RLDHFGMGVADELATQATGEIEEGVAVDVRHAGTVPVVDDRGDVDVERIADDLRLPLQDPRGAWTRDVSDQLDGLPHATNPCSSDAGVRPAYTEAKRQGLTLGSNGDRRSVGGDPGFAGARHLHHRPRGRTGGGRDLAARGRRGSPAGGHSNGSRIEETSPVRPRGSGGDASTPR